MSATIIFFYDVDNRIDPARSPNVDTGVFSPKLGVAVRMAPEFEVFANYGESFRSPNATSELTANPHLDPQKIHSYEVGFRLGGLPLDSVLRASIWNTRQENEIFNNAGIPENLGKSERNGYDIGLSVPVTRGVDRRLTVNADYGFVTAKLVDRAPNSYVPSVPTYVIHLGLDGGLTLGNGQSVDGRFGVQLYGKQHLDQTGEVEANAYQVVTGRLNYRFAPGWSSFGSFRWYPDERYSEIALLSDGVWATSPQPHVTALVGISREF